MSQKIGVEFQDFTILRKVYLGCHLARLSLVRKYSYVEQTARLERGKVTRPLSEPGVV